MPSQPIVGRSGVSSGGAEEGGSRALSTALSPPPPPPLEGTVDEITPCESPLPSLPPPRPTSNGGSTSGFSARPNHFFHSRRIKKGDVSKPWLAKKDPREKWVTIIPCIGLFLGLVMCGMLVWLGLKSVVNHKYCPVLMEDWSRGFDEDIWTREVEVGGFGCVLFSPLFFAS